jgi:hypothetical protein
MSFRVTLTVAALFLTGQSTVVAADPALPADWHGVWSGQLTVYGPKADSFTRPMELRITPRKDSRALTWRMTTEMKNVKRVRDYELVPDPNKPGEFQIDEKNGILLRAQLMGRALYTYYKDGDILISSRFERRGDGLHVELASVETKDPLVAVLKEDKIEIHSYQLGSVQVGELRKKE